MERTKRWYQGIWYAEAKDGSGNFLASLFKENGKWHLEYRFRHYRDDKAFDSNDEKHWYECVAPDDSDAARDIALKAMEVVSKGAPFFEYGDLDFVDLQCADDDPKFFFELGSRPWAQVRKLSPEELDAMKTKG